MDAKRRRIERDKPVRSTSSDDLPPHIAQLSESLSRVQPHFADISLELRRDTPQFPQGTLMLLRLVNFQIAKDATYKFGPYLNLIFGSNGSGKSAIINAIFLLFLGNIKLLDQTHYSRFIQNGQSHASVSALVSGLRSRTRDDPKKNTLVTLYISHETTQWFIDHEAVAPRKVWELVKALGIQVGNLCQFMSQFRVAAFSGESAQQRLRSTEEALGYEGMLNDHDQLSVTGEELAYLVKEITALGSEKEVLESKSSELETLVQHLRDAGASRERHKFLGKVAHLRRFLDGQEQQQQLQIALTDAQKLLTQHDAGAEEYRTAATEADKRAAQFKKQRVELHNSLRQSTEQFTRFVLRNDSHTSMHELRESIDESVLRVRVTNDEATTMRKKQNRAESVYLEERKNVKDARRDLAEMNASEEQFAQFREQLNNSQDRANQVRRQYEDIKLDRERLSVGLRKATDLEKRNTSRLEELIQTQRAAEDARSPQELLKFTRSFNLTREVEIVNRLSSQLTKPVISPGLLTLRITDPRMCKLVGEVLRVTSLLKFVCQTHEDQLLLSKANESESGLFLNTAEPGVARKAYFETHRDELKQLGFDGVITDVLDGPPAMMTYMRSLGLNNYPYSLSKPISEESKRKFEELARHGRAERYIEKDARYTISRSKYGRQNLTTQRFPLGNITSDWALFLKKKDYSSEIGTLTNEITQLRERLAQFNEQISMNSDRSSKVESELAAADDEVSRLQNKISKEELIRRRLTRAEKREESAKHDLDNARQQLEQVLKPQLNSQVRNLSEQLKAFAALRLPPSLLPTLTTFEHEMDILRTQADDAKSHADLLRRRLQEDRQTLADRVKGCEEVLQRHNRELQVLHEQYDTAIGQLRSQKKLMEGTNYAHEHTVTELEREMDQLAAAISLRDQRAESLDDVITKAASTKTELKHVSEKLERAEKRQATINISTEERRYRWVSAVHKLQKRISDNFRRMFSSARCVGYVELCKEDEYKVGTWGLDIFVAFRPGEEPSQLNRQRQSGGERAFCTAFYLLSLEGSKAPFRVLDEINQGMDENNERITMRYIVELACGEKVIDENGKSHQSEPQQYFVVTPKLIPNIHHHQRMNVVVVIGGTTIGNVDSLDSNKTQRICI